MVKGSRRAFSIQGSPRAQISDNSMDVYQLGITLKSDQRGSGSANVYRCKTTDNDIRAFGASTTIGIRTRQDSGTFDYYLISENTVHADGTSTDDAVAATNGQVRFNVTK